MSQPFIINVTAGTYHVLRNRICNRDRRGLEGDQFHFLLPGEHGLFHQRRSQILETRNVTNYH